MNDCHDSTPPAPDGVLAGDATRRVWIKVAITYLVPLMVTLVGVLIGTRERDTYCRSPVEK